MEGWSLNPWATREVPKDIFAYTQFLGLLLYTFSTLKLPSHWGPVSIFAFAKLNIDFKFFFLTEISFLLSSFFPFPSPFLPPSFSFLFLLPSD